MIKWTRKSPVKWKNGEITVKSQVYLKDLYPCEFLSFNHLLQLCKMSTLEEAG
jgi:hypothetical protein